jgi:hypothetical protein
VVHRRGDERDENHVEPVFEEVVLCGRDTTAAVTAATAERPKSAANAPTIRMYDRDPRRTNAPIASPRSTAAPAAAAPTTASRESDCGLGVPA